MPHLRLEAPQEWLDDEFAARTGLDVRRLLDHLVDVVCEIRMENPAIEMRRRELLEERGALDAHIAEEEVRIDAQGRPIPEFRPFINRSNLKHAIVPVLHAGVGGDRSKGFLHVTMSAGNDTPGRTAAVRRRVAEILGHAIDAFVGDLPDLGSVTVHVKDIDRDRGYSTTAERKKAREGKTHPGVRAGG